MFDRPFSRDDFWYMVIGCVNRTSESIGDGNDGGDDEEGGSGRNERG